MEVTELRSLPGTDVMGCAASGWQAERHVFFGDPETIGAKLDALPAGSPRRLYYVIVKEDGRAVVYEYEHEENLAYAVRAAQVDTSTAEQFNSAIDRAMYQTGGQSCVGEAIQQTGEYRGLHFKEIGKTTVHGLGGLAAVLAMPKEYGLAQGPRRFLEASIAQPC